MVTKGDDLFGMGFTASYNYHIQCTVKYKFSTLGTIGKIMAYFDK